MLYHEYLFEEKIISIDEKKYTTVKEYLNRLSSKTDQKIIYCTDETSQSNPLNLWLAQGSEVIMADTVIDSQFIPWLESKNENLKFQRVDSEIDESMKEDLPEIKDLTGENTSDALIDVIKKALDNEKVTVQIKSLKGNNDIPAMILLPEQMRRINDIGALMEQKLPGLPDNHVLLVNKNHPIVAGLSKLNKQSIILETEGTRQNDELIKGISIHLYEMACLSIGGIDTKEMASFQQRTSNLVGKLIEKLI